MFGVFNHDLELVGLTHVGMGDEAEFGVSVRPTHRGRGIGTALFARAEEHARNHHLRTFYVHTLTENKPMLAVCERLGFRRQRDDDDPEAVKVVLDLPRPHEPGETEGEEVNAAEEPDAQHLGSPVPGASGTESPPVAG